MERGDGAGGGGVPGGGPGVEKRAKTSVSASVHLYVRVGGPGTPPPLTSPKLNHCHLHFLHLGRLHIHLAPSSTMIANTPTEEATTVQE